MHTARGSLAAEVQGCTLRSGAGQTRSAKQIGEEGKQGGRRKEEDEEAAEAEAEAEQL